MRSDMDKCVTERPRAGGRTKSPKGQNKRQQKECHNWEDAPKSEKIRQKWEQDYNQKEFTDVLGPLYGYLRSKIGQKWDDVYSEICQNLPKTNVQYIHIHTHINQFVEKNVILIDGQPHSSNGLPMWSYSRYHSMYVNPTTGLLCEIQVKKYAKTKKPQPRWTDKNRTHQHIVIAGSWFEVEVKKFTSKATRYDLHPIAGIYAPYDHGLCRRVYLNNWHEIQDLKRLYGGEYLGVSKRQLNSREIKKLNLPKLSA